MLRPLNIDDPVKFFEDQGFVVEQLNDGMDYRSWIVNPINGVGFSGIDPNPIDSYQALLENVCDRLWVECIAVEERRLRTKG